MKRQAVAAKFLRFRELFGAAEQGFRDLLDANALRRAHLPGEGHMETFAMLKRRYLTGVLVFLSLVAGSAAASAAETGIKARPDSSIQPVVYRGPYNQFYGYRGLYGYAAPRAGYGFDPGYGGQWDPNVWTTGNGFY